MNFFSQCSEEKISSLKIDQTVGIRGGEAENMTAAYFHLAAIDFSHGIFSIPRILIGHEGKPWWFAGDPDTTAGMNVVKTIKARVLFPVYN